MQRPAGTLSRWILGALLGLGGPLRSDEPTADPATESAPANPLAEAAIADGQLARSEDHYRRGEYVEALRCLDLALQFSPNEARQALETALGRQADGDAVGALLSFQEAFRRYPKLVSIFTGLGLVRNETEDYYGAIRDFTTAIQLLPFAYLAYSGRAEAKIGLDDYAGAIEDFSVPIRAGQPDGLARVHLQRGQARLALGEVAAAGEDFAAALALEPQLAPAYLMLSYTLRDAGKYAEALAALDRAIELQPAFSQAYSARSWLHQERDEPDAALADADHCLSLQPEVPEFVLNRAMLLDMLEQPDAARTAYERAATLADDKANNIVWYYAHFHLDLLSRRLDGKPRDDYLADVFTWPDCWQKRIGLYLAGRISMESLLRDAAQGARLPQRTNQECEAYYFAGMLSLLADDPAAASRYFGQCVATNDLQTVELGLARMHLRRLDTPAP